MIYITGDCHQDFERFNLDVFPEQKEMTKDDCVIICGDFGGVWNRNEESSREAKLMDWLENRSFTTLFVDGNHENFDRLYAYPIEKWHGGKVHKIRPSVIHLMRGQVFEIDGKAYLHLAEPAVMILPEASLNRMILILRKKRRNWIGAGIRTE